MGIVRGTKLAFVGVVGATLAWRVGAGERLRQYELIEALLELPIIAPLIAEYSVLLDWSVGVFVGVVAADVLGYLRARDTKRSVELSSTLGVGKGTAAVIAGVLGLVYDDAIFAELSRRAPEIAAFVQAYLGGKAGFCFAVGIWVGAVFAEVVRL